MGLHVLLVDDDKNIRSMLAVSLNDLACDATPCASVEEALSHLESRNFDLVLTDFRMGRKTGFDLLHAVKQAQPHSLTVVMTAYVSFENAVQAIKEGAYDYLPKPFTNAHLRHLIKKVETVVNLRRENEKLKRTRYRFDYFVGLSSPASLRLEEFVQKVAPTDVSVLICGESGTGKSELARLIHHRSSRSDSPFMILGSQDASKSLAGLSSDRGTLFLDEVGDLDPDGQAALLRLLEREPSSGVRVIASTRRDLSKEVAAGKFREDLYFRLNAFECFLVPLRHRKEDLPVLIPRFLREATTLQQIEEKPIPPETMSCLTGYSWPGNIRELRNVIDRLVLLASGREIRFEDLPESIRTKPAGEDSFRQPRTLEDVEREHIQRVLQTEENLERAAEILGITTVTLWRKRKEYGLR